MSPAPSGLHGSNSPSRYCCAMSGKQKKRARQHRRLRSTEEVRACQVTESAKRISVLDFEGAPDSRVCQFAVGWLRAVFVQADALVRLSAAGVDYAGSPNRRSFSEIVLRLQWLHSLTDRPGAIDAMIQDEQRLGRSHLAHLESMDIEALPDFSDLEEVVTKATSDTRIREQAKSFTAAVKATPSSQGLFRAWREETQFTHATGKLAVSYAPTSKGRIGRGRPFVVDNPFESLLTTCLLALTFVVRMLLEDGAPQYTIDRLFDAYFNGVKAGL